MSFDKELLEEANKILAQEGQTSETTAQVEDTTAGETSVQTSDTTHVTDDTTVTDTTQVANNTTVEKPWWDQDESAQASTVAGENITVTQPKQETPVIERDPILDNPVVKQVIEIAKGNGDAQQFLDALGGPDPKRLSEQDLFEIKLNQLGFTEEQKEEARAEFESYSILRKKEITQPVLQHLEASRATKLDQLTAGRKAMEQQQAQIVEKAKQEVEQLASGYAGKELFGWTVPAEAANKAKHDILKDTFTRQDGSFDTERVFKLLLLERHIANIVKVNVQKTKNETLGQVVNNLTNPNANTTVRTPVVPSKATPLEEAEEILNRQLKARGIK